MSDGPDDDCPPEAQPFPPSTTLGDSVRRHQGFRIAGHPRANVSRYGSFPAPHVSGGESEDTSTGSATCTKVGILHMRRGRLRRYSLGQSIKLYPRMTTRPGGMAATGAMRRSGYCG